MEKDGFGMFGVALTILRMTFRRFGILFVMSQRRFADRASGASIPKCMLSSDTDLNEDSTVIFSETTSLMDGDIKEKSKRRFLSCF